MSQIYQPFDPSPTVKAGKFDLMFL